MFLKIFHKKIKYNLLEEESIKISLRLTYLSFPDIKEKVENKTLEIHGSDS